MGPAAPDWQSHESCLNKWSFAGEVWGPSFGQGGGPETGNPSVPLLSGEKKEFFQRREVQNRCQMMHHNKRLPHNVGS